MLNIAKLTYHDFVEFGKPKDRYQLFVKVERGEIGFVEGVHFVTQLLRDLPSIHRGQVERRNFQTLKCCVQFIQTYTAKSIWIRSTATCRHLNGPDEK